MDAGGTDSPLHAGAVARLQGAAVVDRPDAVHGLAGRRLGQGVVLVPGAGPDHARSARRSGTASAAACSSPASTARTRSPATWKARCTRASAGAQRRVAEQLERRARVRAVARAAPGVRPAPVSSSASISSSAGTPPMAPGRVQLRPAAALANRSDLLGGPALQRAVDEAGAEHVAGAGRVHGLHLETRVSARADRHRARSRLPHRPSRKAVPDASRATGAMPTPMSLAPVSPVGTCSAKIGTVTALTRSTVRGVSRSMSLVTTRPAFLAISPATIAAS